MSMKLKHLHILILIISIVSLSFAYIAEYIMDYAPCPLCIYQRFPFLLFALVAIMGLAEKTGLTRYYIFSILSAILLAGYHTGVERGIFEMSSFCQPLVKINDNVSVEEFLKVIYSAGPIAQCNKPSLVIFGFSMTEWNLLLNVSLLFLVIIAPKINSSSST